MPEAYRGTWRYGTSVVGPVGICVLGPPASGKSTLARALALERDMSVFRLGPAVRALAAVDPPIAEAVRRSRDSLGWIDDCAVALVMARIAPTWSGDVVFENFPGRPAQVALLTAIWPGSLRAIELDLPDACLRRRAALRRVCPRCEHTFGADGVCPQCGVGLVRRDDDAAAIFEQRLARYRGNREHVLAALADRGIAVEPLTT